MTTVMDNQEDDFVKDLALTELTRLKVNINEFLRTHIADDSLDIKNTEKILLQEDKKNADK